jgi:flagellar hook-associated protein 3 FlgL
MRVSNRFLYYQLVKELGSNSEKLFRLSSQISSGKRIDKPSEDPLGLAKVLVNRSELSAYNEYKKTITFANGWLARADSITDDVDDLLGRATELATKMSSTTQTQTTRLGAAEEIKQIIEQVTGLANSKYGNKYLFAGTNTQTLPFKSVDVSKWQDDVQGMMTFSASPPATPATGDQYVDTDDNHLYTYSGGAWTDGGIAATGSRYINSADGSINQFDGTIWATTAAAEGMSAILTNSGGELYVYNDGEWNAQYQGNDTTFSLQIGKNDTVEMNTPGSRMFRNSSGDIIMTLMNLERALRSNDLQGISDALPEIESSANVLMDEIGKVGAVMNRLDHTSSVLNESIVNNQATTSDIEDLDYAEAITQLQNQQTIYQAALKSASMITSMSLVDFI